METTPEGAFLTFEKWKEGRIELLCESHMEGWGFAFKGRVDSVSRDEVLVVSEDRLARIGLSLLTKDLGFSFGLNDEIVPEGVLVIGLPLRVRPRDFADPSFIPRREKLSFLALRSTADQPENA
jgi:hypothetical protein